MDLKEYKPLALVFYIDGNWNRNALPLEESKVEWFKKALEECKMVELEWVVINTFDIKEIRPSKFTTDTEKYYYSRTIEERKYILERLRKITRKQNINVIEEMAWYDDPVKQMYRWIEQKFSGTLPKEELTEEQLLWIHPKIKTEELTEEQKEQIRTKFMDLKVQLTKPI